MAQGVCGLGFVTVLGEVQSRGVLVLAVGLEVEC